MNSGFDNLRQSIALDEMPKVATPMVSSFRQFLEKHGRVKTPDGSYQRYTFAGREALQFVVDLIDRVLGSSNGQPISDARLTATGSAQWGKTILELNLLAYAAGIQFRSVGLFLPDEDLVEGIVDSKLRPDVLDQQPWLNSLITLGKAENASGKTVNRKGLFTCTDGRKKSHGMIHGMQKIPTTFSFAIALGMMREKLRLMPIQFIPALNASEVEIPVGEEVKKVPLTHPLPQGERRRNLSWAEDSLLVVILSAAKNLCRLTGTTETLRQAQGDRSSKVSL